MISLIAITHSSIIEMRIYPTMTVMIDPKFKPKWSMDTSHIIGIRQRVMIVKHIVKMIAPMRNITFFNLFFMENLLLNTKNERARRPSINVVSYGLGMKHR